MSYFTCVSKWMNNKLKLKLKLIYQSVVDILLPCGVLCVIKLLTPNDDYSGRTAPLTSKRCILYI